MFQLNYRDIQAITNKKTYQILRLKTSSHWAHGLGAPPNGLWFVRMTQT